MGMFKDTSKLTKQANELKKSTGAPGMREMLKQATDQLQQIQEAQADAPAILEVHVGGRKPYRVMNDYIVPQSAQLGVGAELPIRVDRADPAKIAIDWDARGEAPAKGEIRPA